MSGGTVWILGRTKRNLGAGMTGGVAFIRKDAIPHVNSDSVATVPVSAEDEKMLLTLAQEYVKETESATMKKILEESLIRADYVKLVPLKKS
jgi:glutamate synthase (NADPH/NADH) large chain